MWILGVETSTNLGSVALYHSDGRLIERECHRQRSHSEFIHPAIQECLGEMSLKIKDVDVLAVGRGPGSFTGIRVAGNTMKGLAWATNKPLVSLDSLSILAYGQRLSREPLYCMINAFRNMIYFASFKSDLSLKKWQLEFGPEALTLEQLNTQVKQAGHAVGDALAVYQEALPVHLQNMLKEEANQKNFPKASDLVRMVAEMKQIPPEATWNQFSPLYIRSTDSLFKKQRS